MKEPGRTRSHRLGASPCITNEIESMTREGRRSGGEFPGPLNKAIEAEPFELRRIEPPDRRLWDNVDELVARIVSAEIAGEAGSAVRRIALRTALAARPFVAVCAADRLPDRTRDGSPFGVVIAFPLGGAVAGRANRVLLPEWSSMG